MASLRARSSGPLLAVALACGSRGLAGCGGKTEGLVALADAGVQRETGDDVDAPIDLPDAAPPPSGQRLLFEAGYQNHAWGYTYSGIYVNADGEVWSYDAPQSTTPSPSPAPQPHAGMTEGEITAKYASNAKLVTTVSPDVVLGMYGLVSLAEAGVLIRSSSCADAGSRDYVAWRYDAASATYSPVQLGMSGDTAMRSTAAAAVQLVDWLTQVGALPSDFCAPAAPVACVGSGCQPASCTVAWETAACDGTCVSPARCASVSGCAACTDGSACVIDAAGDAHCSDVAGCSSSAWSCDCAGESLCAGGAAWCRGSSAAGFRCERP